MNDTEIENQSSSRATLEVSIVNGVVPDDVKALLDMAEASNVFNAEELLTAEDMAWDCAYRGGDDACRFIQAKANDAGKSRPVGFLCFGSIPQWQDNYELLGIAVAPEFQRQGIASALVAELERQVMNLDGKRIFVETGDNHLFEAARQFYEAAGFMQEVRFRKQFIPKPGGVVFRKDLDSQDQTPTNQHSERD